MIPAGCILVPLADGRTCLRRAPSRIAPRMLAQLAWLFHTEADAIARPYEWPPRPTMTAEERAEVDRLAGTAIELFDMAEDGGFRGDTDAAFGYLQREYCAAE